MYDFLVRLLLRRVTGKAAIDLADAKNLVSQILIIISVPDVLYIRGPHFRSVL